MFTKCRNRHGGGVSVYVNNRFPSILVEEFSLLNNSIECLGVDIKIMGKSYLLICIYRPPNGEVNIFIDTLCDILTTANDRKFDDIVIFGDLNLDLLNYKDNKCVCELNNTMYSFSLLPLITGPTRVTNITATLIDHIWSTQVESNTANIIIETCISDHFPLLSHFIFNHIKWNQLLYKEIRMYTNVALENFSNDLSKLDWNTVLQSGCANESYDIFHDIFQNLYHSTFP